jgi:hypothetical protein
MKEKGKSFEDFRKPGNPSQCLFSPDELRRCIIIDD